jgi:hypothetical protein
MEAECTERWEAHRREHVLEAKALKDLGEMRDKALVLATQNVDRRLEEMNAFRSEWSSALGEVLTRREFEGKHEALLARISAVESTQASLTGRLSVIAALAGLVASIIVSVLLHFAPA